MILKQFVIYLLVNCYPYIHQHATNQSIRALPAGAQPASALTRTPGRSRKVTRRVSPNRSQKRVPIAKNEGQMGSGRQEVVRGVGFLADSTKTQTPCIYWGFGFLLLTISDYRDNCILSYRGPLAKRGLTACQM